MMTASLKDIKDIKDLKDLKDLKGLGPKSQALLHHIGIFTKDDLISLGPIRAFIKLKNEGHAKISLNFLYAMLGAIENKDWRQIAAEEKGRLLMELEGYEELMRLLNENGEGF